jgi:serine/threonine-protein kinase
MGVGAIDPVLECLSHGEARGHAMDVLANLLTEESLGHFLEALRSPNPAMVSGVAQVLSKHRGYDASRLVALLSDPSFNKSVIESILWAQVETLSARRLIMLIPEVNKDARTVVFRLLEKTADAGIVNDLIGLLSHDDWWVRQSAARLLGEFDEPNAIKSLMRLTKDSQKGVRLQAVEALHKLRDPIAIPALADRLRDDDLKVQTEAIDALVNFADASAVPHLLTVLKDDSEYARRAAVEVLNQVATNEAIYDLVSALRDEDWWVRVRAADALGTLGGEKVVEGVIGLEHVLCTGREEPAQSVHRDGRIARHAAVRLLISSSHFFAPASTLYRSSTTLRPAAPMRRLRSGSRANLRMASTHSSVDLTRNPVSPSRISSR